MKLMLFTLALTLLFLGVISHHTISAAERTSGLLWSPTREIRLSASLIPNPENLWQPCQLAARRDTRSPHPQMAAPRGCRYMAILVWDNPEQMVR